jgi:hypothetical protein
MLVLWRRGRRWRRSRFIITFIVIKFRRLITKVDIAVGIGIRGRRRWWRRCGFLSFGGRS